MPLNVHYKPRIYVCLCVVLDFSTIQNAWLLFVSANYLATPILMWNLSFLLVVGGRWVCFGCIYLSSLYLRWWSIQCRQVVGIREQKTQLPFLAQLCCRCCFRMSLGLHHLCAFFVGYFAFSRYLTKVWFALIRVSNSRVWFADKRRNVADWRVY